MVTMTCTRIETVCPNGAHLVYNNVRGEESIDVSFMVGDQVRHQPVNWRCRMARDAYYPTLKRFYRDLRSNSVTQRSLHYLAGGANRGRHGGWAIRTDEHRQFQESLARAKAMIAIARSHLGLHEAVA